MIKNLIIGALVLGLFGGVFAYMQFNKAHRDIAAEEASIKVDSKGLFQAYVDNEVLADGIYLDKVVEVTGVVSEINTDPGSEMLVMQTDDDFFGVDVYFIDSLKVFDVDYGNEIVVKGYCSGGGEMGVKLIECTLILK